MFGSSVEQLLSGINNIKDQALDAMVALASGTGYQLTHKSGHAGCGSGTCISTEVPVPYGSASSETEGALNGISENISKMKSFGDNLYVDPKKYNNSYGSPFSEIEQMKKAVQAAVSYNSNHAPFSWIGEKAAMLSLLAMVIGMASDCKQSLTTFQDSAQRAFDEESDEPSIQWVRDSTGKKTAGMNKPVSKKAEALENLGIDSIDLKSLGGLGFNLGV